MELGEGTQQARHYIERKQGKDEKQGRAEGFVGKLDGDTKEK